MPGVEVAATQAMSRSATAMNGPDPTACARSAADVPAPALPRARVSCSRGRFLLLVGGLLALIAAWPLLQNKWDKLTDTRPRTGPVVSANTEYWCPMCPGVVSDWPSKCPVCSMTLVRRQKGDMTPLPDGVVARVQLSPYRLQLGGLRTAPVEFLRLEHEVTVAGFLEPPSGSAVASPLASTAEVFEPERGAARQSGSLAR